MEVGGGDIERAKPTPPPQGPLSSLATHVSGCDLGGAHEVAVSV